MTSAKEMELLMLVKKGLEADKILNNTDGYDCTFEEFKKIKSDSILGKKAKETVVLMHDDDVKRIVNYLMSDKNNGKQVKIFSSEIANKDDYFQAARMALSKAIDTFDPSKRTSLSTYSFMKIVYAVIIEATKDGNLSDKDKRLMSEVKRVKNKYASENIFFNEYTIAEELSIDIEEVYRIEKLIELNKKSKIHDNTRNIEDEEIEDKKEENENKLAPFYERLSPEEIDFIESKFEFVNSSSKDKLCEKYNIDSVTYDQKINSIMEKLKLMVSISKLKVDNKISEEEIEIIESYYNFYKCISKEELFKKYNFDSQTYNEVIDNILNKLREECA